MEKHMDNEMQLECLLGLEGFPKDPKNGSPKKNRHTSLHWGAYGMTGRITQAEGSNTSE